MTTTAPKTDNTSQDAPLGGTDDENWGAVAEALNRRMADCRITQQCLSARSGVSVSTIRVLQRGTGRRARDTTLAALSRAFSWPDDHLLRILLGDQPRTVDAHHPEGAVPPPRIADPDPWLRLPAGLTGWWNLRYLADKHVETGTANQLFAVVHLPGPGRPDPAVYVTFESAHAASTFALDHGLFGHLVAQLLFDITPTASYPASSFGNSE
jgi:hypothetical protein